MSDNYLQRRPFTKAVLDARDGALVVPGLGSPTWDCFAAGGSDDYLYSWGGMGLAVPTALGVALARPRRRDPTALPASETRSPRPRDGRPT